MTLAINWNIRENISIILLGSLGWRNNNTVLLEFLLDVCKNHLIVFMFKYI